MPVVKVLLPHTNLFPLDYLLPANLAVKAGDLVIVPFRKSEVIGIIWDPQIKQIQSNFKLKEIKSKLNLTISHAMLKLITATARYYLTSLGSIAKLILPLSPKNNYIAEHCDIPSQLQLPILNDEQKSAFTQLKQYYPVTVLQGPTGSGKTEVYLHLIAEVLQKGQQILVLLPEIALTTQIIQRFTNSLKIKPDLWHSSISKGQKQKILAKVLNNASMILIGARSSLFLPYKNLGLIIVDEEHAEAYKQEAQVSYHARDVAVLRGRLEKVPVLLCSATPSLETYHQIYNGLYKAVYLTKRYYEVSMPQIQIIDMLQAKKTKSKALSLDLVKAISQNLKAEGQSLLFLNRRGYAPLMLCDNCGYRLMCISCTTWLVMHKAENKLACHHCGYSTALTQYCTKCETQNSLVACGPGIEKIYEEIKIIFPDARVIMVSSDNMSNPKSATLLINQISNLEVDIIIGTQIITKGYHFPNLNLVGIIDADLGLVGGDLRAAEKNFQLLQQAGGRAGRQTLGKVLVQTRSSSNFIFNALKANNLKSFIDYELQIRKITNMPPFSKMVALIMKAKKEQELLEAAKTFAHYAPQTEELRLLGPATFMISKVNNQYRVRILLIGSKTFDFNQYFIKWFAGAKLPKWVTYKIDVDPYSFT